jgi:putative transposase
MIKTAAVKLHNPSNRKRAVMMKAFKSYHLLTAALLNKAKTDLDRFQEIVTNANKGYTFFKEYRSILNSVVLPSNLKVSACKDATRMLLGYLASGVETKQPPNVPKLRQEEHDLEYLNTLDKLGTCSSLEEENCLRDAILASGKDISYLPILFGNVNDRRNPGVTIAFHPGHKKYYAILFVGNVVKGTKSPKLVIKEEHGLYNIKDNSQILYPTGSQSGIIVPIDFGFYQLENYIKKGIPKEAHLVYRKDKDEFYIHFAFEFTPEKIEVESIMGVDRGITNIAAYAVINPESYEIINRGYIDGSKLTAIYDEEDKVRVKLQQAGKVYSSNRKRNFANIVIHLATNEIVSNALKYKSQVYVEDLAQLADRSKIKARFKGKPNTRLNVLFNSTFYQRFLQTLTYKLEYVGLPKPKEVHPAWTSTTCPKCGKIDKLNRASQSTFTCINCGHTDLADLNAGVVIAAKGQWHWTPKVEKVKRYGGNTYEDFVREAFK